MKNLINKLIAKYKALPLGARVFIALLAVMLLLAALFV